LRPFLKRRAIGRINRSYFGGFRVNPSPTKVTFVIIRFHSFSNHKQNKKTKEKFTTHKQITKSKQSSNKETNIF
jgi:hypothetical protein